jgi:hypothetical protein
MRQRTDDAVPEVSRFGALELATSPVRPAGNLGEDPIRFGSDVEFIMDQDQKQTVATLAAAIVIARGAKSIAEIRDAWADANWIINPVPSNSRYKLWKEKHGEASTTSEGDEQIRPTKDARL